MPEIPLYGILHFGPRLPLGMRRSGDDVQPAEHTILRSVQTYKRPRANIFV